MAHQLPTPAPSPEPMSATSDMASTTTYPTLPTQINTATRKLHTELNQLITRRLPLALPPRTESPLLYGKGLVAFSSIFVLFECEWSQLVLEVEQDGLATDSHDKEVQRWLANLRPATLARSGRIEDDLMHLRKVAGPEMYQAPGLGSVWTRNVRLLLQDKPHTLVAFAWVMYMATFSGGRWVRQQLANADVPFWTGQHVSGKDGRIEKSKQTQTQHLPGFSFLSFDGDEDGEDIKAAFKARLSDADDLLTEVEKEEVVDTAKLIFERCIGLVKELDYAIYRQTVMRWVKLASLGFALLLLVVALWYFDNFGYL